MSRQQTTAISAGSLLFGLVLLLLLFNTDFWLATAVAQAPVLPAAKGEQCVADTDLMRINHMDMLNHQRDETVIDGVRGKPFSLVGCVNCHAQTNASGTPVRIDAPGQFCQSCHQYAAVSIDCFSCHAAIPEQESEMGFNPQSVSAAESRYASTAVQNAAIDTAFISQSQPATAVFHLNVIVTPIESADLHAKDQ